MSSYEADDLNMSMNMMSLERTLSSLVSDEQHNDAPAPSAPSAPEVIVLEAMVPVAEAAAGAAACEDTQELMPQQPVVRIVQKSASENKPSITVEFSNRAASAGAANVWAKYAQDADRIWNAQEQHGGGKLQHGATSFKHTSSRYRGNSHFGRGRRVHVTRGDSSHRHERRPSLKAAGSFARLQRERSAAPVSPLSLSSAASSGTGSPQTRRHAASAFFAQGGDGGPGSPRVHRQAATAFSAKDEACDSSKDEVVALKRQLHAVLNCFQTATQSRADSAAGRAADIFVGTGLRDPRGNRVETYVQYVRDSVCSVQDARRSIGRLDAPVSQECMAHFSVLRAELLRLCELLDSLVPP